MIPPGILDDIHQDPFLAYMHPQVIQFDRYLDWISRMTINIKGIRYNPDIPGDLMPVDEDIGYITRWSKKYDNRILEKLYNWKYHYLENPDQVPRFTMMVTYTGAHASPRSPGKKGLRHMAYLAKFHEAHRKGRNLIRKYIDPRINLSVLEGHPESGYVHSHDLYFLDFMPSQHDQDTIMHHWTDTLGMGSQERGIQLGIREPRDFKEIQSLIAYPMAYLGKSSIGDLTEWTKYDAVFNTCLWLSPKHPLKGGIGHQVRAFQPSRALSSIMAHRTEERGYIHIETTMRDMMTSSEPAILYRCPDYKQNIQNYDNLVGEETL